MNAPLEGEAPSRTLRDIAPGASENGRANGRGVARAFRRTAELVSIALFGALFLNYVAQVFMRYVMNDPLVWSLEVAGILFITVSLWTAATLMPFRDHVRLDLVYELFPLAAKRVLASVSLGALLLLIVWSIPDNVALLEYMYDERTNAIAFNLGHLFVLFIFFLLAYAARAAFRLWRLWRPGWRDEL